MRLLRAFDVDGGAIDDQRALPHRRHDLVPDPEHVLASGQHSDDDFGALHRGNRALGNRGAVGLGLIARGRDEIERDHLMAGLDQIGGHGPAHIAEADECDRCHVRFLRWGRFLF
jgi:hypothetical protein